MKGGIDNISEKLEKGDSLDLEEVEEDEKKL